MSFGEKRSVRQARRAKPRQLSSAPAQAGWRVAHDVDNRLVLQRRLRRGGGARQQRQSQTALDPRIPNGHRSPPIARRRFFRCSAIQKSLTQQNRIKHGPF